MKTAYHLRNFFRALACSPLIGALVGLYACGDEPKTNCGVAPFTPFAAKLIEKSRDESTDGACDSFGPDGFNADPELGINSYYARNAKGQPDYAKGSVAIQTAEIGGLEMTAAMYGVEDTSSDTRLYSLGPFSVTEPNADNLCPAPTLSPTHLVLAEVPAQPDDPTTKEDDSFPGQPAVDISLTWSNFLVYVTPSSLGTQVQADLTDARVTSTGDTCTIKYRVVALSPSVPCQATDADSGDPLTNDDGTPQLDPTLCDAEADLSKGRTSGSGISPDTRYTCDPAIAFCVIDSETIPALK